MATRQHIDVLLEGVAHWNAWRESNPKIIPDLRGAKLEGMELDEVNFNAANLSDANLSNARVCEANLEKANLTRSKLRYADFVGANLQNAILHRTDACGANFFGADLSGADCSNCTFDQANFQTSFVVGTSFRESIFWHTDFTDALMADADFHEASFERVVLGANDLRNVQGLDYVQHNGPSVIGIDSIYESQGQISDIFLIGCGVPTDAIDGLIRPVRCGPPIQWHSCFISYSTKDEGFARRLHGRMRQANMRVWFAPEDMKGGKRLHEQVFEAIQLYDKLLLILSDNSILSDWVITEIRKARNQEQRESRRKLFPIRLTDFATLQEWTCFDADSGKDLATEVREYFIPDFSKWKDHDVFETAFARLQRDLQAEGVYHQK